MAKNEEKVEKAPKGEREARWEAHLEAYAKANPVKYAEKKKAGELDEIPESFK